MGEEEQEELIKKRRSGGGGAGDLKKLQNISSRSRSLEDVTVETQNFTFSRKDQMNKPKLVTMVTARLRSLPPVPPDSGGCV